MKISRKFLGAVFSGLISISSLAFANAPQQSTSPPQNWYDHFIFKDPTFNFEFIRALGYTYEKGADIGEAISTAENIQDGDFQSWYHSWLDTAERIENLGVQFQNESNLVSAREAFFRASSYYRSAGFFMDAKADRAKSISTYAKSRESFLKAIASLPYISAVKIPYENTALPGYLIRSEKTNAPIVIVNTGFDGTGEELYFDVGAALHARGYNCLIVEGPGQGSVLREQNLPFRPDWEKVVTPIVNYIETLSNVDKNKIALMGISMGGYLAPRAAAFEPRIKALIANGGVYDFGSTLFNSLPKKVLDLVDSNPKEFNTIMENEMKKNTEARWFFENGMWSFHADSPAEFVKKLKQYSLKDVVKNIKAPTLVVNSESDAFMKKQAEMLFKNLDAPKTYLLFTKKEAAQSHCQMGATAISNELILNWLDKTFNS